MLLFTVQRTGVSTNDLKHSKNNEKKENSLCYNISLKYRTGIS